MYNTILCAIENSDEAEQVLEKKAFELSTLCSAKLFITHVIPYTLLPNDYQKELKENALPSIESKALSLGLSLKKM